MVAMLEQLELAVRLQVGACEFYDIGVGGQLRKCPHLAQGQVDSLGRRTSHYLNQHRLRSQHWKYDPFCKYDSFWKDDPFWKDDLFRKNDPF